MQGLGAAERVGGNFGRTPHHPHPRGASGTRTPPHTARTLHPLPLGRARRRQGAAADTTHDTRSHAHQPARRTPRVEPCAAAEGAPQLERPQLVTPPPPPQPMKPPSTFLGLYSSFASTPPSPAPRAGLLRPLVHLEDAERLGHLGRRASPRSAGRWCRRGRRRVAIASSACRAVRGGGEAGEVDRGVAGWLRPPLPTLTEPIIKSDPNPFGALTSPNSVSCSAVRGFCHAAEVPKEAGDVLPCGLEEADHRLDHRAGGPDRHSIAAPCVRVRGEIDWPGVVGGSGVGGAGLGRG